MTALMPVSEKPLLESLALQRLSMIAEVEAFLADEVHLLDDRDYRLWLDLFTSECRYVMPVDPLCGDDALRLHVFYDDRARLEDRVARLTSGEALTEDPPTLTVRTLSAVQVRPESSSDADELLVRSNFVLLAHRHGVQRQFGGRYRHRLVRREGTLRIVEKRVTLLGSDAPQRAMTFLF